MQKKNNAYVLQWNPTETISFGYGRTEQSIFATPLHGPPLKSPYLYVVLIDKEDNKC
jgi:hypothetical protein